MSAMKINLLKNRKVLSEKDYLREQALFRYGAVTLTVIAVVTAAVSLWNLLLSSRLSGIEKSIATSSSKLQGLTDANARQIYLKSRLQLITDFLDERGIAREALQRIYAQNIPGATVTAVMFASDTVVSIQVNSRSQASLNEVIAYYQKDSEFFTQVISRGVSLGTDGSYDIRLDLTIPKGKT